MEKVYNYGASSIPVKSWVHGEPENGAMTQAYNLAHLPFAFRHIALMPDTHQGYGMPIGAVMATKQVIVPNAVGVDIGCGMRAVQTDYKADHVTQDEIKAIMGMAREAIPVGFNHHKDKQKHGLFDLAPITIPVIVREWEKAQYQLGTLGGGNHFIELQAGDCGYLWLMIHSGSRNFGLKIATEYHNKAKELTERWFSNIPHKDLAFLPMDSKEGNEYYDAMSFALGFAKASRGLMMKRLMDIVSNVLRASVRDELDVHHNYAQMENHFGSNVLVHRKGAIQARDQQVGIVPGSQGTHSYITVGLGNPESFMSSSHGAGRTMSRSKAKKELDLDEQIKILDDLGVVHGMRNQGDLDEAPGAYKDIDKVMESQKDLTTVDITLRPLGVIKS